MNAIENLQKKYDIALSFAQCYSMRDRGWDKSEQLRLDRIAETAKDKLDIVKLSFKNETLARRVDDLERSNSALRGQLTKLRNKLKKIEEGK